MTCSIKADKKLSTHSFKQFLNSDTLVSVALKIAVSFLVALLLEVFFFNLDSFTTQNLTPVQPTSEEVTVSDDGYATFTYTFDEQNISTIETTTNLQQADGAHEVSLYATDEGNKYPHLLGSDSITFSTDPSQFFQIYPSGKVTSIQFVIDLAKSDEGVVFGSEQDAERNQNSASLQNERKQGKVVSQDLLLDVDDLHFSAEFNVPRPFDISQKRIAAITVFILFILIVRPASRIFHTKFDENKRFAVGLVAISSVVVVALSIYFVKYTQYYAVNEVQYFNLAKALANGHFYIDEQPSEALLAMSNPYDTVARNMDGVTFLWDYAFYQGKYYVYFGILPCLIFHLPWYLLTGQAFPMLAAAIIANIAFVCGLVFLLYSCCQRWIKQCSQGMFLLLFIVLLSGSWMIYACKYPGHYALPIITGLAFAVWGVACWIRSTSGKEIVVWQTTLGSLLVACTLAARPQLLAVGVIALVLLADKIHKNGLRKCIVPTLIALLPFVVVFALVAYYNFARFGSPFDFGASYNLTTNDMTHRGFTLARVPLALFSYLVQPPVPMVSMPYLSAVPQVDPEYWGQTISEPTYGGLLILAPVLLIPLVLFAQRLRKRVSKVNCILIAVLWITAIAIVVLDANGAGILMRYYMDFGLFFALAAVLAIGMIYYDSSTGEELVTATIDGHVRFRTAAIPLYFLMLITVAFQLLYFLQ